MKKILITGISGFIGTQTSSYLARKGYAIVGIDSPKKERNESIEKDIEIYNEDIRSKNIHKLFQGIDIVFHFAAKNNIKSCQEDPVETMSVNVEGTANVCEAARRAGVQKIIFSSSSVVEEDEKRQKGFYAISKITSEKIIEGYNSAYRLPYTILRYFNIYGPGQDYTKKNPPLMSALITSVLKNEKPTLYFGYEKNKRDFIYIDDITRFHLLCVENEKTTNALFRLGSGKNYSIKEVWEIVKKITGSSLEPIITPPISYDTPSTTTADIQEAEKIGWQPTIQLEEGIKKQYAYLKKELKGQIKNLAC